MLNLTIAALQEQMTASNLTAQDLVQSYLHRIQEIDRTGPCLNSIIEVNPDAREIAAALDEERAAQGARGPLHGIPIVLKDNIDTADGMQTTAGSLALAGSIAPQDSFVARRLREAGAVILGKANLSEWANFRSTRSTSGWSSRGGQTRNPYALDRSPCGSSSGSAVAVAADLCVAAIGTETDGSIVCPSSVNGIVGIKPTIGLVSRAGIIPIAHSQDTAGPMARSVADAAIVLGAITGFDPRDPAPDSGDRQAPGDYTQFLDPDGLRGARIGIARDLGTDHPEVRRQFDEWIKAMQGLGAVMVDPVEVKAAKEVGDHELEVLLYEFKADLNAYLGALGPNAAVHSLADVIAFNERNRHQVMPYFGQEHMLQAQDKGPLTEPGYRKALEACRRLSREEGIDLALKAHKLDAIVAPTTGPAWTMDLVNGDHYSGGCSTLAAVAGYPHVTVPAGFIFGLPVGLSFFAGAYQEPTLIRLAYAFEQATQARRPPRFLPTADLDVPEQ